MTQEERFKRVEHTAELAVALLCQFHKEHGGAKSAVALVMQCYEEAERQVPAAEVNNG